MRNARTIHEPASGRLRLALLLTWAGLLAERLVRAFWPFWVILLTGAAALMLGAGEALPLRPYQALAALWALAALGALWRGGRRFRWPARAEAAARLDRTLPGRPLAALGDTQAIGSTDPASRAVWEAHRARMAARLEGVRPPGPDLRLARFDRFGLRYIALLFFMIGILSGGLGRVADVGDLAAAGNGNGALAAGPGWEGWAEPPAYTNRPSLYLNDLEGEELALPMGTRITLRFYGGDKAIRLNETVSAPATAATGGGEEAGRAAAPAPGTAVFEVARSGEIEIPGGDGAHWRVTALADQPPSVELAGPLKREARGRMIQPFTARDDYGVISGTATFRLDPDAVERRYGLATPPDPREEITLDLPMPIRGARTEFTEELVDDLSKHPWAGLPVVMTLMVEDGAGQKGESVPLSLALPGRRFFDPLARAVIEQRRDLLWARANGARVAAVLRAVSHRPEGFIRNESGYLILRTAIRRLEVGLEREEGLAQAVQEEVADALWEAALLFEEGSLADARERMERAQERLAEAMRNGASKEEIEALMQELREATQDYLRQLAEQQRANPDQQNAQNRQGESQEITQDQIQAMLDRIQELMEQGRMAEAQALMEQFNQMMQNLQVTENGKGGEGRSPGQQAMEGLKETLRDQQGLSDQAFRDLQEQFNPGANAGENAGNEGRNGGQGRGQSHEGQNQGQGGRGQEGQKGDGEGRRQGENGGAEGQGQSLAERQRALREQLGRQLGNLPGQGSEEGRAAREALEGAAEAMRRAEEALRQDDLAGALDGQAEAMQGLREGMRNLGEALAQQEGEQGRQGEAVGKADQGGRDPLGRQSGSRGNMGTDRQLLQGEDVYRRARKLLDEIRRRTGEKERPKVEREYLERLLDQF